MVVGIEVLAHCGLQASRSGAFLAEAFVLAVHPVHVGRRTAKVTDVAFEVFHLNDFFHFTQDGFFAS